MAVLKMRRAALLLGLWAAAGAASCFSPRQPDCAFSCAGDGRCPTGYTCSADDGWCHRDDGPDATCFPSQLDAGSDAPVDAGGG